MPYKPMIRTYILGSDKIDSSVDAVSHLQIAFLLRLPITGLQRTSVSTAVRSFGTKSV
jgi:hypothetical protein